MAKNISDRIRIILSMTDMMSAPLRTAAGRLRRFSVGAQQAGMAMAAGAAVMSYAMYSILSVTIKLDDEMKKLGARINGVSSKHMKELTAQAEMLGRTTSFTTIEVAQLMTKLAQAGRGVADIKAMTAAMMDLGRATDSSPEAAADAVMSVMAGFGMAADQSTHVSDVLTYAVANSNQTLEELHGALTKIGPTAKAMNMSLEEVVSSLMEMANMNIKDSIAGTGMRAALTMLATKGEAVANALGVSARDMSGNMRGLAALLGDFREKTSKMADLDAIKATKEAFGKIGINAALSMGSSTAAIQENQAALENLAGYAHEVAMKMDSGIGGALRKLNSAFMDFRIILGKQAIQTLGAFVAMGTNAFHKMSDWANRVGDVGQKMLLFTTALIAGAITLLGSAGLGIVVAGVISVAAGLVGAIASTATAFVTIGGAVAAFTLANPIILGIAATILIIGTHTNKFAGMLGRLVPSTKALGLAWETVQSTIRLTLKAIKNEEWDTAYQALGEGLEHAFTIALDNITMKFKEEFANWLEILDHPAFKVIKIGLAGLKGGNPLEVFKKIRLGLEGAGQVAGSFMGNSSADSYAWKEGWSKMNKGFNVIQQAKLGLDNAIRNRAEEMKEGLRLEKKESYAQGKIRADRLRLMEKEIEDRKALIDNYKIVMERDAKKKKDWQDGVNKQRADQIKARAKWDQKALQRKLKTEIEEKSQRITSTTSGKVGSFDGTQTQLKFNRLLNKAQDELLATAKESLVVQRQMAVSLAKEKRSASLFGN